MGVAVKFTMLFLSTYSSSLQESPASTAACQAQYKPFSQSAKSLFAEVAPLAGVPRSWAYSSGLHSILSQESEGLVGVPNYSIKDQYGKPAKNNPELWSGIHHLIRQGEKGSSRASSSATGLGQLLATNADTFYPSGRVGIGDCREEAVGMLRYIKAAYGSPSKAWNCYGKISKNYCSGKRFKEGY
ncbi:MAG TPA: hypothetical protein VJH68_05890 [Candidatus Nanoarchaeia archaeon]|nr:hypothetical protein [Candidatus Nanoarchaeia archaeon]